MRIPSTNSADGRIPKSRAEQRRAKKSACSERVSKASGASLSGYKAPSIQDACRGMKKLLPKPTPQRFASCRIRLSMISSNGRCRANSLQMGVHHPLSLLHPLQPTPPCGTAKRVRSHTICSYKSASKYPLAIVQSHVNFFQSSNKRTFLPSNMAGTVTCGIRNSFDKIKFSYPL